MGTDIENIYGQKGNTWPRILLSNYERYGEARNAMRYKRYGIWQTYTWKDYYLDVKYLALGLSALGFEPGHMLIIIGNNAPQWYAAELAAQADRGASIGVDPDATPSEISRLAACNEARFAVVEDQEQVDKLIEVRETLPLLERVIYWRYKGLAQYRDPILMGYREALDLGRKYEAAHPDFFEKNVAAGKADDVCALVYTSGATGAPKAAVHTHRTMMAGAEEWMRLDPWREDDNLVPRLSPASIMGQWSGIGCHLLSACTLNFAEERETGERDTREIAPTIAVHGARFWEGQAAGVQARILGVDALTRLVFRILMPVGRKAADVRQQGRKPGWPVKVLYRIADMVLFRRIRQHLGLRRARICYSTGGLLSPGARQFYCALSVPIECLYFTTEGGLLPAVAVDASARTAGVPGDGAEVRIAGDEIISRQPGIFAGYYKDTERTASVLRDGWFHSGDRGMIGRDGRVLFLDRAEAVVELATGERLLPQFVESRLRSSPYVRDAWVFAGPDRAYASAVIVINYANVSRWAGQRKIAHSTLDDLSQKPEVYALVGSDIEKVNSALAAGCRVRKYVSLHREFDPDQGELTSAGNLRRAVLSERYREVVDAIYAGAGEATLEVPMMRRDGRVETREISLAIASVEGAAP